MSYNTYIFTGAVAMMLGILFGANCAIAFLLWVAISSLENIVDELNKLR